MTTTVAIVGDSFAKRLCDTYENLLLSGTFDYFQIPADRFKIENFGSGGCCMQGLRGKLPAIMNKNPDYIFMIIGSNDINRFCNVHEIKDQFINLYRELDEICYTIYLSLPERPREDQYYHKISSSVNKFIAHEIGYERRINCPRDAHYYHDDRVHLNDDGNNLVINDFHAKIVELHQ